MRFAPPSDTLRLRDEIARALLDEADDRPAPTAHPHRGEATASQDDRRDRRDDVDLLTGGGVSAERR